MQLYHFSEDPGIAVFEPRPVRVPSERGPVRDWLNGPLVWAIEDAHQALYLFPRDCPRILIWPTPSTTAADHAAWFGASPAKVLAYVEWDWWRRLGAERLYRYHLPVESFESLSDAGMWVARTAVTPLAKDLVADLPAALQAQGVELRFTETLAHLRPVWNTTLHASGVRLRHARDWG
jgi:hypothetical protein